MAGQDIAPAADGRIFRASRRDMIRLLILGIVMTAASAFAVVIALGKSRPDVIFALVGGFGVVFFGLGVVVALRQVRDVSPALGVDRRGMYFEGLGLLPWEDIDSVAIDGVFGARMLSVRPRDPAAVAARMSRARQLGFQLSEATGFDGLAVAESRLPGRLEEIVQVLMTYAPASTESGTEEPPGQ